MTIGLTIVAIFLILIALKLVKFAGIALIATLFIILILKHTKRS